MLEKFAIFLFVTLTQLLGFSAYGACFGISENPNIECAILGDELASKGDIDGAKKAWKKSCELGTTSSCRFLKEYGNNESKVSKDFSSSTTKNIENSEDYFACELGTASNENCHKLALDLSEENPKKAIEMLELQCMNEFLKSCVFLGRLFSESERYWKEAKKYYETPCVKGDERSCAEILKLEKRIAIQEEKDFKAQQINLMKQQVDAQRSIARENRVGNFLDAQRNKQLHGIKKSLDENNDIQVERSQWEQNGIRSYRTKPYRPSRGY